MTGAQHGAVSTQRNQQVKFAGFDLLAKRLIRHGRADHLPDTASLQKTRDLLGFLRGIGKGGVVADGNPLRDGLVVFHEIIILV